MYNVLILQHAEGEWIGSMKHWFGDKPFVLTTVRLDHGDALPDINYIDWLVIMGGPMSAYDEQTYPWLIHEKILIRQVVSQGKPVLGICLGAQLIASAMGATVKPNVQPEIGWFEVVRTNDDANWLPSIFTPLSWHGDIFDVPEHAVALAKSEITPCQGFALGRHVIGLQFHLEAQKGTAAEFLALDTGVLPSGRFVQSAHTIINTDQHIDHSQRVMFSLLDHLYQSAL